MKCADLTIENLFDLIDKVAESGIDSLAIEEGGFKLAIEGRKKETVREVVVSGQPAAAEAAAQPQALPQAEAVRPAAPAVQTGNIVKSPIVGTFYSSAAPDKPAFAKVGDRVKKGDTIFIIESMKLMNEVQSEFDGVVKEILIDNASPVEYGQPVMIIE